MSNHAPLETINHICDAAGTALVNNDELVLWHLRCAYKAATSAASENGYNVAGLEPFDRIMVANLNNGVAK